MRGSGTNSQFTFSLLPSVHLQRSTLDRSHTLRTTFNFGQLIPILVDEALPGDTISCGMNSFGRLATMIHPIMENMFLDFFFFAVPNRLLWTNWQKFMGERVNPGDSIDFNVPEVTIPVAGWAPNSLADYFGLPTLAGNQTRQRPSALWFRGYALIYNEWFRDQNLIPSITIPLGDGPDPDTTYSVLNRAKRHDYFTSALPFAQKGQPVSFPIGTKAPVIGGHVASPSFVPTFAAVSMTSSSGLTFPGPVTTPANPGGNAVTMSHDPTGAVGGATGGSMGFTVGVPVGAYTDLQVATSITVNALRESVATQRLLEADARGGTRYTEILRAHFGVISPDARLQRPEYLGGGTLRINVNPVATTAAAQFNYTVPTAGQYQAYPGQLGAFGTASGSAGFSKSFTEHCVIIGLVVGRADLNYQQGLERMWSRRKRYDFYWPEFAHLGEQPIRNKELYCATGLPDDDTATGLDGTFGYQERYAEYRYKPSRVCGRFRSNAPGAVPFGTLDSWHLAQNFTAQPVLNQAFIEENPDVGRVLVVTTGEPELMLDCFFNYRCTRPMPTYAIPGLGMRL